MKIVDIDKLVRDENQDNLYNLFGSTFKYVDPGVADSTSVFVSEEESMRIDLISQRVYNSDEHVDILLNINYIDNPLNIMEGDELIYPGLGSIAYFRPDDVERETTPKVLLNPEKSTKVDEARKQYVEQNYTLTPTSIDVPQEPVKIVGNNIVIGQ